MFSLLPKNFQHNIMLQAFGRMNPEMTWMKKHFLSSREEKLAISGGNIRILLWQLNLMFQNEGFDRFFSCLYTNWTINYKQKKTDANTKRTRNLRLNVSFNMYSVWNTYCVNVDIDIDISININIDSRDHKDVKRTFMMRTKIKSENAI